MFTIVFANDHIHCPLPYHSTVATIQWDFQSHTCKVNVYTNMDALQKPNTNRETKDIEPEIYKNAKDTIQYWFNLLSMMIAKLPQKKKKKSSKYWNQNQSWAKTNYNQNTFIETIFKQRFIYIYIYIVSVLFHWKLYFISIEFCDKRFVILKF